LDLVSITRVRSAKEAPRGRIGRKVDASLRDGASRDDPIPRFSQSPTFQLPLSGSLTAERSWSGRHLFKKRPGTYDDLAYALALAFSYVKRADVASALIYVINK